MVGMVEENLSLGKGVCPVSHLTQTVLRQEIAKRVLPAVIAAGLKVGQRILFGLMSLL